MFASRELESSLSVAVASATRRVSQSRKALFHHRHQHRAACVDARFMRTKRAMSSSDTDLCFTPLRRAAVRCDSREREHASLSMSAFR